MSPVVATAAVRLVARLSNRVTLPANVVISNVPGPRQPLYFAGAKLESYIPVSTITNGIGLNITVHSYEDRLDFGLVADRDLVPDLWDLVDLHIAEIDRLFEATGAERGSTPPPAAAPAAARGRRPPRTPATKVAAVNASAASRRSQAR
jgi:diacylglycerol O-acyltransferase / wax synthase